MDGITLSLAVRSDILNSLYELIRLNSGWSSCVVVLFPRNLRVGSWISYLFFWVNILRRYTLSLNQLGVLFFSWVKWIGCRRRRDSFVAQMDLAMAHEFKGGAGGSLKKFSLMARDNFSWFLSAPVADGREWRVASSWSKKYDWSLCKKEFFPTFETFISRYVLVHMTRLQRDSHPYTDRRVFFSILKPHLSSSEMLAFVYFDIDMWSGSGRSICLLFAIWWQRFDVVLLGHSRALWEHRDPFLLMEFWIWSAHELYEWRWTRNTKVALRPVLLLRSQEHQHQRLDETHMAR